MHVITKTSAFTLPFARNCATDTAALTILPGGRTNRHARRQIDRHRHCFCYVVFQADPKASLPGYGPDDFDANMVAWALRTSTLIIAWAGLIPPDRDLLTRTIEHHAVAGGRVAVLLVREERFAEWGRAVVAHKRADAEVMVIHPKHTRLIRHPGCGRVH